MRLIYNKNNGKIIAQIPSVDGNNIPLSFMFKNRPTDFLNSLSEIMIERALDDTRYYYVQNDKVVKYEENIINEIDEYGKILSDEDRLGVLLTPSNDEVQKAEQTIELLSILQEVELI